MKTKHTGGEWKADIEDTQGVWLVEATGDLNGEMTIANCHGPDREANARLISAAPDLLATCKLALTRLDELGEMLGAKNGIRDDLTAAIAKATGAK